MTSNNKQIIQLYKSRTNLLEILKERNFDVTKYENFTLDEIGMLYENDQLDMLLTDNSTNKNIYIKYYVNKVLKSQNIYDIIQDLFYLESILTKNDDLMIIIKDEPNDTLQNIVKDIWMEDNIYLSLVNIKRLQFNILKHKMVPKHTILSPEEETEFKRNYNITDNKQIPDISYFSPISIVLGIRPNNIVKIERNSRTSITSNFYRVCKI
jgi:DNA-directed RNA polymerase subunit H (RpoH/RPB5)